MINVRGTRTKSIGRRFAASAVVVAIAFALSALITPIGLTGAYAQSRPTITVEIDSTQLNRDRTVTVDFTVECSEDATITSSGADVQQSVGRFGNQAVFGSDSTSQNVPCDEDGVQLTQTVIAFRGFFTPGRAVVSAGAQACIDPSDFETCNGDSDTQVVRLRR
jgi:hypothetical protein